MRWLLLAFLTLACRSGTTAAAEKHESLAAELERGIALVEQGDLEAGIAALRGVQSGATGDRELDVKARCWIVTSLTRAGDPEGALRERELALELAPENPWLHYARGVALYEMGDLERAREAFTHGLERDPRHIKSLQWRALVLRDMNDDRAAVEDLTRALECIESAGD